MRYFLLIIGLIFTASCSRPDFDTSVQVEAWLRSLDPNAEVIEVWCKGDVEYPPASGTYKELDETFNWTAKEALVAYAGEGLEWSDIVARAINAIKAGFPRWALSKINEQTPVDRMVTKWNLQIENLRCDGKPLRSPPIQIGKCPNSTDGCDQPPSPTDQPPPPPPPPPGGGDF